MTKDLAERIPRELNTCFGVAPTMAGKTYRIAFGAIKRLDVTISADGKSVIIDTESVENLFKIDGTMDRKI